MDTFYIKYLIGNGSIEEVSASYSDAFSFAEEYADADYYEGFEIVDKGWRYGL